MSVKIVKVTLIFVMFFSAATISQAALGEGDGANPPADQAKIERTLMCLCGCNTTIKDCPHVYCNFATPARKQIAALISEGKSEKEITDIFLAKYGEEIFAAPRKKGFNLVGYIMPFLILVVAGALVMLVLRVWSARGVADEKALMPSGEKDVTAEMDDKIEKELEEMD